MFLSVGTSDQFGPASVRPHDRDSAHLEVVVDGCIECARNGTLDEVDALEDETLLSGLGDLSATDEAVRHTLEEREVAADVEIACPR